MIINFCHNPHTNFIKIKIKKNEQKMNKLLIFISNVQKPRFFVELFLNYSIILRNHLEFPFQKTFWFFLGEEN